MTSWPFSYWLSRKVSTTSGLIPSSTSEVCCCWQFGGGLLGSHEMSPAPANSTSPLVTLSVMSSNQIGAVGLPSVTSRRVTLVVEPLVQVPERNSQAPSSSTATRDARPTVRLIEKAVPLWM